jgi:glycopeptide antibiotics resistance protein
MKKTKSNKIKYALFIVTYFLSCITISTNQFDGYFGYENTNKLLIKFILVFISVTLVTIINKSQQWKLIEFTEIFSNVLLVFYIFDYFVTNISGSTVYYRLWWLCIIYIANAGYYIGLSITRQPNFEKISRKFWLSMLPTYIFTFLLIFARTPNSYFDVNLKLGQGLLSYLNYLITYFQNAAEFLFNFVGNVAFFIPLPFLTKAVFPKVKYSVIMIIGIIVPFLVEGYQYIFKCGSVDIDDIVFNLAGFLIGFIALIIEGKIHNKKVI